MQIHTKHFICKICGYTSPMTRGLAYHITHKHKILIKDYYDTYIKLENEGLCITCGKEATFDSLTFGYRQGCFEHKHPSKYAVDKQLLHHLYIEEKLSTVQIGKQLNINKKAVLWLLRKYSIAVRSISEGTILNTPRGEKSHFYKNGFFVKDLCNRKYFCEECGKEVKSKTTKLCIKCSHKGERSDRYIDGRSSMAHYCSKCGSVISNTSFHNSKLCRHCMNIELSLRQDGKSSKKEFIIKDFLNGLKESTFIHNEKRDFQISYYFPDFVDEKNKLIIEVYGDFWHANPEIYKADDLIYKSKNIKATDIWDKNERRINTLKKYGYKILILWEKDINKNIEIVKQKVIDFIKTNT